MPPEFDERTIERIAEPVAALLREELQSLMMVHAAHERPLRVQQVADYLGVAR